MGFDASKMPITGMNLIEAGAGTGKTHTLTTIYLRLVAESDIGVGNILVVTFTEAATQELTKRVRDRIEQAHYSLISGIGSDEAVKKYSSYDEDEKQKVQDRLARALRDFDDAAVFTIHGFCKRMLEDNAFESGVPFDSKLVKNQSDLTQEIVHDYFATEVYGASPAVAGYLTSSNVWPSTLMGLVEMAAMGFDTTISPEQINTGGVLKCFTDAFANTRDHWHSDRNEIVRLLTDFDGFKANIYNDKKLALWFSEIDTYLDSPEGAYPIRVTKSLEPALVKFTPQKLTKGTKKKYTTPTHPFFEACGELVDASNSFASLLIAFKLGLIKYSRAELTSRKQKQRLWSFDDLLVHTKEALSGEGSKNFLDTIRGRFKAVLIDEFQDTDNLQYKIFKQIFSGENRPLFYIGDPKQSIYGFRGANIYTYLNAAKEAGNSVHTLDTNWRSDPSLVRALNTLFERPHKPFLNDQITYKPVIPRSGAVDTIEASSPSWAAPFQVRFIERNEDRLKGKKTLIAKNWANSNLPHMVATDIAWMMNSKMKIDGKPIQPSDLAILTRTNKQAEYIRSSLAKVGIPSVLFGSSSVFKSNEADELLSLLDACGAPSRKDKIRKALATNLFGFSGNDIWALGEQDEQWEHIELAFKQWHELWLTRGFAHAMRSVLEFEPHKGSPTLATRILTLVDGERRLTNIRHLIELLGAASLTNGLGPSGLMRWFRIRQKSDMEDSGSDQLRLETDGNAVKLTTIHKAKGLEYKVVYCPYLWDGISYATRRNEIVFHDPENQFRRTLDVGSAEFLNRKKIADFEEASENLRLLYVALTRAKNLCVLVWGGFNGAEKSALGYLLHQAEDARDPASVSTRIKTITDKEMLEELDHLATLSDGSISVSTLGHRSDTVKQKSDISPESLSPRRSKLKIKQGAATYSFSSLTAGGTSAHAFDENEEDLSIPSSYEDQVVLSGFDRGARAGTCLHAIFEKLDFRSKNAEHLSELVDRQLGIHGFQTEIWKDTVAGAISDVLNTPLSPDLPKLCLGAIENKKKINELEFIFPIKPSTDSKHGLTSGDLASLMSEEGSGLNSASYSQRLGKLEFTLGTGFVKGFIDLVFEWQGKYYLVDYKSNYLGPKRSDYKKACLDHAMVEGDYILQYHLYTVALHRYLNTRLQDYDYNRHFGGVFYLFLRGMSNETGSKGGIFWDRPRLELISKLEGSLGPSWGPGGSM